MYWITYLQVTTLYFLFKKKSYNAISYYYYYYYDYYFQEGIYFSFSFTQKIENKIEGMFDLITSLSPLVIRRKNPFVFFFFNIIEIHRVHLSTFPSSTLIIIIIEIQFEIFLESGQRKQQQ